jgi:hypothetical protein
MCYPKALVIMDECGYFFVESRSYKAVLVIVDGSGSSKALVIMDESRSLEVQGSFRFGAPT